MTQETADSLVTKISESVEILCATLLEVIDRELLAIGLITTDNVQFVCAKILFAGDLPADAEPYQLLSPVEWVNSEEAAFTRLNHFLATEYDINNESDSECQLRVRSIFDTFANAFVDADLTKRFGTSLYVTFAGVDPGPHLVNEERRFVRQLNPPHVFDQWCEELG